MRENDSAGLLQCSEPREHCGALHKAPQKTRHYCVQGVLTLTKLELRRVVPLIALLVSHPTANSLELSAGMFCRPVSSAFASLLSYISVTEK